MSSLTTEQGSFADTSFAMLLIRALDKRWSGVLMVTPADGNIHRLQVDRGLVCRVLVADSYARLGRVVVDAGVISDGELGDVLEGSGLLGDAMIRANLIDNKTLKRALLLQLLTRMTRIFGMPANTNWHYSPFEDPFEGMPEAVRIDTLRALWAGISVHGEMGNNQQKALYRIGASPLRLRAGVNIRRFGFTADAAQLVERIDGRSFTLRELVKQKVTPSEVCERIIYVLAVTRHLDFMPAGADNEGAASSATNDDVLSSDHGQNALARGDDAGAPGRRVARIKLRRVAVRRGGSSASRGDKPSTRGDKPSTRGDKPSTRGDKLSTRGDKLSTRGDGGVAAGRTAEADRTGEWPVDVSRATNVSENELRSWLERVERETALEILGVTRAQLVNAAEGDVLDLLWRRYEALSRRWQPDNAPRRRPEVRAGMTKIYRAITVAFESLLDPDSRAQALYIAATSSSRDPVSSGPRPVSVAAAATDTGDHAAARPRKEPRAMRPTMDSSARSSTLISAGRDGPSGEISAEVSAMYLHERALISLSVERYEEALNYCKRACDVAPDNADYCATSIWIRANVGEQSVEELLEELDMLLMRSAEQVAARYYRGVLRKRLHYHSAAQRDFERVLRLEPKHEGAKSQLASLLSLQRSSR